jgi:hypothetical protein
MTIWLYIGVSIEFICLNHCSMSYVTLHMRAKTITSFHA